MRTNFLYLSTFTIAILMIGCTSEPRLNPYVPKENIKVVYVEKSTQSDELIESKQATYNATPTKEIKPEILTTGLKINPNPVSVNQAFKIEVEFKAEIPNRQNELEIVFYFNIEIDDEIVYKSKSMNVIANNGLSKSFNVQMDPVPESGIYKINTFISYEKLLSKKSVNLVIK